MALFFGGQNDKNGQNLTNIFPKRTRQRSIISVTEMIWALCRSKHLTLIPSLVRVRVSWSFHLANERRVQKSVKSEMGVFRHQRLQNKKCLCVNSFPNQPHPLSHTLKNRQQTKTNIYIYIYMYTRAYQPQK